MKSYKQLVMFSVLNWLYLLTVRISFSLLIFPHYIRTVGFLSKSSSQSLLKVSPERKNIIINFKLQRWLVLVVCIPFMFLLQKCIWQLELAATHLVINNQFIVEQSFFGQCVFKSGLYFLRIYFLTFLHHILLNFSCSTSGDYFLVFQK